MNQPVGVSPRRPEGGWSAVLRVCRPISDEELVLELLDRAGVLVHPGYFFDFATEDFLVVSLLPEPTRFEEGVRRLAGYLAESSSAPFRLGLPPQAGA